MHTTKLKRLIYFATEREADSTRRLLNAHQKIAPGLYVCEQGYVRVGGMGILAAACGAMQQVQVDWDELWNFGIAASLSPLFPVETRVVVKSVQRPAWFPEGLEARSIEWYERLFPTLHLSTEERCGALPQARLVSCDFPVHQPHLADHLRGSADLLDMEGYGLAFSARQLGRPCFVGKWVTDSANIHGPNEIQRLLNCASDQFAAWIQELLI